MHSALIDILVNTDEQYICLKKPTYLTVHTQLHWTFCSAVYSEWPLGLNTEIHVSWVQLRQDLDDPPLHYRSEVNLKLYCTHLTVPSL